MTLSCSTWCLVLLCLFLHHDNKLGVDATKAALKALTRDAFIREDDRCIATNSNNNSENTLVRRVFYDDSSQSFSDANAARESDVFYLEMSSVNDSTADQAFQIRVGQGGQIYSLKGAYGEAMPPNNNANEAFVKDVCQMVAIKGTPDSGDSSNNDIKINQAGAAMRHPANDDMQDNPFWSLNAGPHQGASSVDCSDNSCRILSWGQPFLMDGSSGSSEHAQSSPALFYTRYTHCGNGVLEVTSMVHNMADAPSAVVDSAENNFHTLYSPAINLRHSTFLDARSGNDMSLYGDDSDLEAEAPLFSKGGVVQTLDETSGYTVFATERVPAPSYEYKEIALPCVSLTGAQMDCNDTSAPSAQLSSLVLDPDRACSVQSSLTDKLGKTVISCFLEQSPGSDNIVADFGYESRHDPITLIDSSSLDANGHYLQLQTDGIWFWARQGARLMFFNTTHETLEDINAKLGYGVVDANGVTSSSSNIGVVFDTAQVLVGAPTFGEDSTMPPHTRREDISALAIVHGTTSAEDARGKSFLRLGEDLPARNDALKMTVQHRVDVSPGETYVDRYYIVNDALSEIMDDNSSHGNYPQAGAASQWSDATVRQKISVQEGVGEYHNGEGRGISLVRYGLQDDFYVSLLETEYDTCAMANATMTSCQGSSVPQENHYAYFYLECGPGQLYTGPDRYHFTPDITKTDGILKPYLCKGYETDSRIRPKLTLVGFFPDDGSCDALEGLTLEPDLCLKTFVDGKEEEEQDFEEPPLMDDYVDTLSCGFDNGVAAPAQGSIGFLARLALEDNVIPMATPWNYIPATDIEGAYAYVYTSPSGVEFLIQPIYYSGLPFQGKCTRVFAWLSVPVKDLSATPIPGAVLLHGGGGSAFKLWCEQWAQRDMASIAIAHEGQIDIKLPEKDHLSRFWERHDWAGPFRVGRAYSDSVLPNLHDQWMYHAVAQAILANTLLRNEPSVNADEVGVTGVSWGGVITSTVIGIDHRFAFAIPGYGCGSLGQSLGHLGHQIRLSGAETEDAYNNLWDPILRFKTMPKNRAPLPTLWISFPEEVHFPLPDQAATYRSLLETSPSSVNVSVLPVLIPNLRHGHSQIWNREENYEFVKSVLSAPDRPMFAQQVEPIPQVSLPTSTSSTEVTVYFESTQEFTLANLISSTGDVFTTVSSDRIWITKSVASFGKVDSNCNIATERCVWQATAVLPPGTTSWYINLCTNRSRICASSFYNEASRSGGQELIH